MKKCLYISLILCLICTYTAGCSDKSVPESKSNSPITQEKPTTTTEMNDADSTVKVMRENESVTPKTQEISSAEAEGVDVDLTAMSSTMVYAEVYNMMLSPDDYLGKTVKMSGPYYASYYDETDMYYHYVIIEDATACCQQGLEFIWNGDHTYPGDYPEDNAKIEVVGVFESYEELNNTYYYLDVDDVSILK